METFLGVFFVERHSPLFGELNGSRRGYSLWVDVLAGSFFLLPFFLDPASRKHVFAADFFFFNPQRKALPPTPRKPPPSNKHILPRFQIKRGLFFPGAKRYFKKNSERLPHLSARKTKLFAEKVGYRSSWILFFFFTLENNFFLSPPFLSVGVVRPEGLYLPPPLDKKHISSEASIISRLFYLFDDIFFPPDACVSFANFFFSAGFGDWQDFFVFPGRPAPLCWHVGQHFFCTFADVVRLPGSHFFLSPPFLNELRERCPPFVSLLRWKIPSTPGKSIRQGKTA